MLLPRLLPDPAELSLDRIEMHSGTIVLYARTTRAMVPCPECGSPTGRVHSRYHRRLHDLPWLGLPVCLCLTSRRFFCDTSGCLRRIFTERLTETTTVYARQTLRLSNTLREAARSLGGEAACQLLHTFGVVTSGDSLLRRLRPEVQSPEETSPPRVLGIDEWAWNKGQRYGTILVDLETHRVMDLLPDRSTASVVDWLQARPGVEVVSRDRSPLYIEAITRGAPEAVQVADRWHLLRNLGDAVTHALERCRAVLRQAAHALEPQVAPLDSGGASAAEYAQKHPLQAERRARRLKRYKQVVELHRRGLPRRAMARQVGIDVRTVRRWLRHDAFPERQPRPRRPSKLDPFAPYLEDRLREGCRNAAQLFRELHGRGYTGGASILRAWMSSHRATGPEQTKSRAPTLRQTAWLFARPERDLMASERAWVERIVKLSPELAQVREQALEFHRMFDEHDESALEPWLDLAEKGLLRGFATGIRTDFGAVRAAIELPWSNGQVEGHVNRLKLIKRQMYGRAGFDLLRARVLHAA